jgi:hypothetical protein
MEKSRGKGINFTGSEGVVGHTTERQLVAMDVEVGLTEHKNWKATMWVWHLRDHLVLRCHMLQWTTSHLPRKIGDK